MHQDYEDKTILERLPSSHIELEMFDICVGDLLFIHQLVGSLISNFSDEKPLANNLFASQVIN